MLSNIFCYCIIIYERRIGGAMIAERIKLIRKTLNLSQKEFAAHLGLKQAFVSNLETGYRNPDVSTLLLLKEKFGISRGWLETGKGTLFSDWRKGLTIIKSKSILNRYELDFLVEVMQAVWYSESEKIETNQVFIFNLLKAISYIIEHCNVLNLKEMKIYRCWGGEIPIFSDLKKTLTSVTEFLERHPEASNTTLADWTTRALIRLLRDGEFDMTEEDEKAVSGLLLPWGYYVALSWLNKEREKLSSAWFDNLEFLYKDKTELQITTADIPKNIDEEQLGVYLLAYPDGLNKALIEGKDLTGVYTIDLKDKQVYIDMTIYDLVEFMLLLKTIPETKQNTEHKVGGFILTLTPETKHPYALRKICSGFSIMINFTQEQFTKLKEVVSYFEMYEKFINLAYRLYIEKYGFV